MPFVQVAQKSLCLEIFTAFSGLASRRRNPASRILSEKSKSEPSNLSEDSDSDNSQPVRLFGYSIVRTLTKGRIRPFEPIRLTGYSTNRVGYEKSDAAAVSTGRIIYEQPDILIVEQATKSRIRLTGYTKVLIQSGFSNYLTKGKRVE